MDQPKSASEGTLAISVCRDFALSGYLIKPEPHQSFKSVGKSSSATSVLQSLVNSVICKAIAILMCVIFKDLKAFFSITAYFTFLKRKFNFKCAVLPRSMLCCFVFQFPVSLLLMNYRGARAAETALHVNCYQKETMAVIESWNAQVSSYYYISCTKNTTVVVTTWKTEREGFFFFFWDMQWLSTFSGSIEDSVHNSGLY